MGEPTLKDTVRAALAAGHEGMWSDSWDQDDASSGFWIPYEEYIALKRAAQRDMQEVGG